MHQENTEKKGDLASRSTMLPFGGGDGDDGRPGADRLVQEEILQEYFSSQETLPIPEGRRYSASMRESPDQASNLELQADGSFSGMIGESEMSMFQEMQSSNVRNEMNALHPVNRNVPQNPIHAVGSYGSLTGSLPSVAPSHKDAPTRFLWIGNLTLKATRPMLCTVFERFGLLEDLVAFPGRMYAFVTYQHVESAMNALESLQSVVIKDITGDKGMVIKYRPERKTSMYGSEGSRDGSSGRGSSVATGDIDLEPSPRIWLGNIAPTATAANLQSVLGRFGHLVDAAVFPARIGPLGYAFVKFERIEDAINAYNTLNNAVVPALSGTKQVKMRYKPVSEGVPARDTALDALQASIPSRHIWIGNVTQKPSEDILIKIFSRFGTIESARVFSAKSYAFVNYYDVGSAIEAITKLDGVSVPVLTGLKPLVMRYQHDSNGSGLSQSTQNLNPKMIEILARSRTVPDSQQGFVNSMQQQQIDHLADYSLLSNLNIGTQVGQMTIPSLPEQTQADASRISAMLQNLAAMAPPKTSGYPHLPPGYTVSQDHAVESFGSYTNQNLWVQEGKNNWQSSAQHVAPNAFQSWDLGGV